MQENLTENNNPLNKSKSKYDSGETTYNDEKFPKASSNDSEKLKQIKLLQEKINSENNLIETYDSQLENLRKNNELGNSQIPGKKKSIFERMSLNKKNKLINNLKLKNSSLYTKISSLAEKENELN